MTTRTMIATAATVLCTTVAAHAGIELHQQHSFSAAPGQRVLVQASFHKVEVMVRPGATVEVTVDLRAGGSSSKAKSAVAELTPEFREDGRDLVIRSTRRGERWSTNLKGRISIAMPPDLDLRVTASSGSVSVDGDLGVGNIACNLSSGGLTIRGAAATLEANSSSGSIRVSVARPLDSFTANASSGSIRLEGGARAARAGTSSGSITLAGLSGDATLNASSGSIAGQWIATEPDTVIRAGASSGGVTLRLPSDARLQGEAVTGSGGIRSDFPGSIEPRHALFDGGRGTVNIQVQTSSGSIRLLAD